MKSLAQGYVAGDQSGTMVAIVVHHHFTVDLKNCTVVGLHGKFVETVCGDSHVAVELESILLLTAELLQVKGTCSSRHHPVAVLEVHRTREIAVEDRVVQSGLEDIVRDCIHVRPVQESRPIHNAASPAGGNHDEIESRLLVLRERNLER